MESNLYLCTKSKEGEYVPFFIIDGSYETSDEKGGSIFNMDCLISNINSKKFEDKVKKTEVLQSCPNNKEPIQEKAELDESNVGGSQSTYQNVKKEKKIERRMATMDLIDSMAEYLEHN